MRAPTGWVFADGWVLAAIGVYQRPCSLLEVIAAGDWMNHAVLEQDEVDDALSKLVAAGLVRIFDDWSFELTDDGAALFSADVRSIQKQLEIIESSLADLEPVRAKVAVPNDVMSQALADYREHQGGTTSP